ncbi:MAG: hypothetical protein MHMPM18_004755 [Marteilia pararefringens]
MSLQLSDNHEINRKMIESFEVFSKIYENEDYYKKQFVLIGNKCDELVFFVIFFNRHYKTATIVI